MLRVEVAYRAPEPHVEEVRKVCVGHGVVVVGVRDHSVKVAVREGEAGSGAAVDGGGNVKNKRTLQYC